MRLRLLLACLLLGGSLSAAAAHAQTQISVFTIAGGPDGAFAGDGRAATRASLNGPAGLAVTADGTIFVADTINQRIRRIDPLGRISTFAGTGRLGFSGDGGPATRAEFQDPTALAVAGDGTLFIADTGNSRIRVIRTSGVVSTLAGTGDQGFSGDGGPSAAARVNAPAGVAIAPDGSLYLSDTGNNRVRRIQVDGRIVTVAGTGAAGFAGDGGRATEARLNAPTGLAVAPDGSLLIADTGNNRIRRLGVDAVISTVAGSGGGGSGGDGGSALAAQLNRPVDVAASGTGGFFVVEAGGNRVRQVNASGRIARVAGAGGPRFGGDGGSAASALFNAPRALESMAGGAELLVADTDNNRVRYLAVPRSASRLAFAPVRTSVTAPLRRTTSTVKGRRQRSLVVRDVPIPITATKPGRLTVNIATRKGRRVVRLRRSVGAGTNILRLPRSRRVGRRRLTKDHYVVTMTLSAGGASATHRMELIVR